MDPNTLRFAETHEWASLEGNVCTVGLTKFAVEQLTDIIFIELPKVGKELETGKAFGSIESVKSVNDLYAPVGGKVVEVNKALDRDLSLISTDPYAKGWLIKVEVPPGTTLEHLKTHQQYQEQIASEGH